MSLAGAALLGGAFTAAASADDSLVGDLLGAADDVLEETTAVVESVSGADADAAAPSTAQVEQSPEQPDSVVTEVVESVVETTEVVTEVAEPVQETTETVTEVAEPVQETTETVTEVAEPVQETTEVVAEVAEPVQETTETVTEVAEPVQETTEADPDAVDVDEPAEESGSIVADVIESVVATTETVTEQLRVDAATGSSTDQPNVTVHSGEGSRVDSAGSESESVSPSVLGEVTELIEPITARLDQITEPVAGRVITPAVDRVAESVTLPVVDEAVAPVLQDVVAPVTRPVMDSVVQNVFVPVADPVVESVTGVVTPVVTSAIGEPIPVVVEDAFGADAFPTVHVMDVTAAMPLAELPVDSANTVVSDVADLNPQRSSSPRAQSSLTDFFAETAAATIAEEPSGHATATSSAQPAPEEPNGQSAPTPGVAPAPAPTSAANSGSQGFGAGFADIVGGLLMPANALTSDAAASPLSSAIEVILKVAVAPD